MNLNNAVRILNTDLYGELINLKKTDRKKRYFYNFKISNDIWFLDDLWDLNELNINNRQHSKYRLNFRNIPKQYLFYVKCTIIDMLIKKNNRVQYAHEVLNKLGNVTRELCKKGYSDLRLITESYIDDYFNEKNERLSCSTTESLIRSLKYLLYIGETFEKVNFQPLIAKIDKMIKQTGTRKPKKSTNEYIPDRFLDQIVSIALKDIDDENLKLDYRIIACLIVILAETGMRGEEVCLLETRKLDYIKINDNKLYFLHFLIFKNSGLNNSGKKTHAFLTEKAVKAYITCENLINSLIDNLSEEKKIKAILKLYNKGNLKRRYTLTQLKEMLSKLSNEQVRIYEKELRKYLFMSEKTVTQKKGEPLFRSNLEWFFIRHMNDFDISKIPINERSKIKMKTINSETLYNKVFSVSERENMSFNEMKSKEFMYVNPHMFRVTVCTKLFQQGVHWDFIMKHMNHLEPDMTMYYCKSDKFMDLLKESTNLVEKMLDEDGIIEPSLLNYANDIDKTILDDDEIKFKIKKINEFVSKENYNKINIIEDIKKITSKLDKSNTPIVENEFGACIRSLIFGICSRKQYFSSISEGYFTGVQLPNYKYIHLSYDRFLQKKVVLMHNRKVAEGDDRYEFEYQREKKAMTIFINKTLLKELNLLCDDINQHGTDFILKKHPEIRDIIENTDKIRGEINEWII